jgi:hypothetical protein
MASQNVRARRAGGAVTAVIYLRPRSATIVAYLDTLAGRRPFTVRIGRQLAELILRGSAVRRAWRAGRTECYSVRARGEAAALIVLAVARDGRACASLHPWRVDRIVRAGYMLSGRVREEVMRRALERLGWRRDAAEAYVRAWLKSDENFELPADDPDAPRVGAHRLVWKFGAGRWVVQVPPWRC